MVLGNFEHTKGREMKSIINKPGKDLYGSSDLVLAARDYNWKLVDELIAKGADPKSTNEIGQNILFFALIKERIGLADKFYDLGVRLNNLSYLAFTSMDLDAGILTNILMLIAQASSRGRNYFCDENISLAKCCEIQWYERAEKLIPLANKDELNRALLSIDMYSRFTAKAKLKLIDQLITAGADPKLLHEKCLDLMRQHKNVKPVLEYKIFALILMKGFINMLEKKYGIQTTSEFDEYSLIGKTVKKNTT
jgi:hypothetical protein